MTDRHKLRMIELNIEQIKDSIADINTKLLSLQNQPIIIQAKDHIQLYEDIQEIFKQYRAEPLRPMIIFPSNTTRVTDSLFVGKQFFNDDRKWTELAKIINDAIKSIENNPEEPKPCHNCSKLTDPTNRYVEVQLTNGEATDMHCYCNEDCKDNFYYWANMTE
jgi:hypothetical protein